MKSTLLTTLAFALSLSAFSQVKDVDGNEYKTIKIREQEWMAENLNVSHFRNGDLLCVTAITPRFPFVLNNVPDIHAFTVSQGFTSFLSLKGFKITTTLVFIKCVCNFHSILLRTCMFYH